MKTVEIFVIGKYEFSSRVGTWIYYLNYKKAVIKRSGIIKNAGSPNRTTLVALYKALEKIKEPCQLLIHSKAALGFKKPKQSANKDLIFQILTTINKAGHLVTFDTQDDFGRVDIWEQVYGTNSDGSKTKIQENIIKKEFKSGCNLNISRPDIKDKDTPNEVFNTGNSTSNWKDMYNDLLNDSKGTSWVPGSGGY